MAPFPSRIQSIQSTAQDRDTTQTCICSQIRGLDHSGESETSEPYVCFANLCVLWYYGCCYYHYHYYYYYPTFLSLPFFPPCSGIRQKKKTRKLEWKDSPQLSPTMSRLASLTSTFVAPTTSYYLVRSSRKMNEKRGESPLQKETYDYLVSLPIDVVSQYF